jgi:hypothetical protein
MLLEGDQHEPEPVCRGWQGTVLIRRRASRLTAPPVQGPVGHVPQEGVLKGGYQRRQLIPGQADPIQHLARMGREIAIPSHRLGLLSGKAQYNPNRDELLYRYDG